MLKTKVALAGNRTGENSTPEPPMLVTSPNAIHIKYCIHVKNKICIGWESNPVLPRGRREFYQ